ncbi:MAG: Uma2 family endonuclease [Leptolyngbyaceae cyanobacterium SM1_3_5]|nr:Uma2 family endonuclease [Leptolyngbyaceae cyanobacterium SM1_3_5]
MTQAKTRFTTIEEYAALDTSDLPEGNYELVNGVIIEMGAEADQNVVIAGLLFSVFLQFVPYYLIRRGTEIAVPSQSATSRYPDLMVLTEATRAAMRRDKRSLITPEMPAPCLVVEVVSPGKPGSDNYDRDYIEKPKEYAQRGIPEFWQIDPARSVVFVLTLEDGSYKAKAFRGSDRIESEQFKQLNLTVEQILNAGMSQ